MNPLDLRGPEFLAFYAVLGGATLAALHFLRRGLESAAAGRVSLSDPYLIAYLREGGEEALRVATISLVDRGLLKVDGDSMVTSDSSARQRIHRPIERDLLETFSMKRHARSALRDAGLKAATTELREALEQQGLLPGRATKLVRWGLVLVALAVLWGTAGAKVVIALSRGRHNVLFLIVAAVALAVASVAISFPRRTRRGETLLEDLKTLFRGLEQRADRLKRGAPTEEAALLAAVYGIVALPSGKWNFAHTLYPPPEVRAAYRSSAHTGSGSSCGSSSSSCGSSCGGGGCGGGCGGCGS